jgi:hypothetical protein
LWAYKSIIQFESKIKYQLIFNQIN